MSIKSNNSKLDARRFRELHDKYRERLLQGMIGFLRNRDAAEDVTAAAFAAAFKNLAQFRQDPGADLDLLLDPMRRQHL
jgi:DNA-directed RNA polymerase specialized sigma24 family protein